MPTKELLVGAGMWTALADALMDRPYGGSATTGTAGTGMTVTEYGSDREHMTKITFSGLTAAIAGAALGFGKLLYTLPAGAQVIRATYMSLQLTAPVTTGNANKMGIGQTIASGAVSVLNGTAGFMDAITEQTGSSAGVAVVKTAFATASPFQIVSDVGGTKTIHANYAGTWTDTGNVTLAGTVIFKWDTMS